MDTEYAATYRLLAVNLYCGVPFALVGFLFAHHAFGLLSHHAFGLLSHHTFGLLLHESSSNLSICVVGIGRAVFVRFPVLVLRNSGMLAFPFRWISVVRWTSVELTIFVDSKRYRWVLKVYHSLGDHYWSPVAVAFRRRRDSLPMQSSQQGQSHDEKAHGLFRCRVDC